MFISICTMAFLKLFESDGCIYCKSYDIHMMNFQINLDITGMQWSVRILHPQNFFLTIICHICVLFLLK